MQRSKIDLQAYLDNTSILILITDRQGNIVEFNSACEKSSGYSLAEVSGKPLWQALLLPEDQQDVREIFNTLTKKKHTNQYKSVWVTKDGSRRTISWTNTVILDNHGEVEYIISNGIDSTEQLLAEKAFKENDERYSQLFMDSFAPMLLIDAETGYIVNANQAALRFYKYSQDDIRKRTIADFNTLPPSKVTKKMREARTQRHNYFLFKHRLADGQVRDVEVYSSPVVIDNRTLLFSIIHDITGRKQAEEEIISVSKFPEENPNPVIRFSKDGRILYANRASAELLKMWQVEVGKYAPGGWQEIIEKVYASNRLYEVEVDCPDRVYSCILAPLIQDGYINLYGRDITSKVEAERERERLLLELDNEKRRWQSTVESMLDPVVVYEQSGKVSYRNAAYLQLLNNGVEADLVAFNNGQDNSVKFHNSSLLGRFEVTAKKSALKGIEVRDEELILSGKQGSQIHLVWNASPLHDVNGNIDGAVLVFHDISELEHARKELKQHAEYLERLNRDLEDFLFLTTHDLQEPMRKIRAFGELMEVSLRNKFEEEELDHLRRMNKAATRMQKMLDELLIYARLTAHPAPMERVNLNRLVDNVLVNLKSRIDQSGAIIEVGSLPPVEVDYNQFVLLFQHLLTNALKFQKEGQRPVIKISCRETQNGHKTGNDAVTLVVEDNGIGFDDTYLQKAFMPFQRLVGRSEYEGSGMGLTICRKIVEYHKGKITAESSPGMGSKFIIQLPIEQV